MLSVIKILCRFNYHPIRKVIYQDGPGQILKCKVCGYEWINYLGSTRFDRENK